MLLVIRKMCPMRDEGDTIPLKMLNGLFEIVDEIELTNVQAALASQAFLEVHLENHSKGG